MGALYLLDESGRPFKRATFEEADGLPVITGVTREQLNAELKGTGLFFPGQLFDAIRAAVDSKGNVYVAEDEGRRLQDSKSSASNGPPSRLRRFSPRRVSLSMAMAGLVPAISLPTKFRRVEQRMGWGIASAFAMCGHCRRVALGSLESSPSRHCCHENLTRGA